MDTASSAIWESGPNIDNSDANHKASKQQNGNVHIYVAAIALAMLVLLWFLGGSYFKTVRI